MSDGSSIVDFLCSLRDAMFNAVSRTLLCLTTFLVSTSIAPNGMAGVSAQYLLGVGKFLKRLSDEKDGD